MAKQKKDPNFPMQGKGGAMGGKYATKSTNLSKKTLKAAGAAKAAKKRTVDISQTKREGSRTVGPGGKPLTGTVTLQDGSKAVYKNGRRVQAADARKPKAAPSSGRSSGSSKSGGSSGSGSGGGGGSKPPKAGTVRIGAGRRQYNRWDGKKWVPVTTQKGSYQAGAASSSSGSSSVTKSSLLSKWNSLTAEQKRRYSGNIQKYAKAMGINPTAAAAKVVGGPNSTLAKTAGAATSGSSKPPAGGGMSGQGGKWKYVNGRWVSSGSAAAKPTGPKKGDKKTFMTGPATYDGTKWVKDK